MQKAYKPKLVDILTTYRATLPVVEVSSRIQFSKLLLYCLVNIILTNHDDALFLFLKGLWRSRCCSLRRRSYQVLQRAEELEPSPAKLPQDTKEHRAHQGAGALILPAVQQLPGTI